MGVGKNAYIEVSLLDIAYAHAVYPVRSQFLWTPYADCIMPDYCIDPTASFLCDTYLVCWSFVEAHKAGCVYRQLNRYQRIPQYCDRMLHNARHLCKSYRRGRKGADWAKVHKFFINEWDLRHDRFQATFDHATATMDGRINPGYMAWYNRITVLYLVQPATQSTIGMNESASSMKKLIRQIREMAARM
ncbi:uncharacterized protein LOC121767935 isoform X2 [Salvia splendens]|uniref:uncharacterized protein LOC121767935 isoform X2 n=1 Tax=Salvia splendens TaxID=180675 RepID=UPI001C267468|nr:uncharacterized protein LOC121767935 isoform X2 [Salvia splendens]